MDPRQFEPTRQKRILKLALEECKDASNLIVLVGANVAIAVTADRIRLRSLKESWLSPGLRGRKEILIRHLTGVQFRKTGGATRGFIQFVYPGANEQRGGSAFDAVKDENTVLFDKADEADFEYLYRFVLHLMDEVQRPSQGRSSLGVSTADELTKLHALLQSGALTQPEFDREKQRLIGGKPPDTVAKTNMPRTIAQPSPVVEWEDDGKPERSAFYHMARGFSIVVLGFVALIVVGVVATALFSDDGNDANGTTNPPRSEAPSTTEQPAQTDPGPLLTGIVVMMNVANTDDAGSVCYGIGDHAMLTEGAEVSVTAIGGHQDREATLSSGTVDQYGHCRMAFGIEWFDVDEYQFGFDNDLFVHCDREAIVEIEDNYTTQIRIAPNGAYCQSPAN